MNKDSKLLAKAYELVLESENSNKDLEDFKSEFKWYQTEGAFVDNIDLVAKFNQSTIEQRDPSSFDNVANCYTKLINGKDEETRFKQWVDFYLKEQREEGTIRANTNEGKINYLKNLLEAVKAGKTAPSMIIRVKTDQNVLELMVGGRTRAAAAKVANIKAKARIITILPEEIKSIEKVKAIYKQVSI